MSNKIIQSISNFTYKFKYVIAIVFLIVFGCSLYFQSHTKISYSYKDYNELLEVFPEDDNLVIVYDNEDEEHLQDLITYLEKDENVTSIQGYGNTIGVKLNYLQFSSTLGISSDIVKTLYFLYQNDVSTLKNSLPEIIATIKTLSENPLLSSYFDEQSLQIINQYETMIQGILSDYQYSSQELADLFAMDKVLIDFLFLSSGVSSMTLEQFTNTILESYQNQLDEQQLAQLQQLKGLIEVVKNDIKFNPNELALLLNNDKINADILSLVYAFYNASLVDLDDTYISMFDMFMFLCDDFLKNETYSKFLSEDIISQLETYKTTFVEAKKQLVGEKHSRLIVTLSYELESEEIYQFYKNLEQEIQKSFEKDFYLVGNSAMSYELSQSFQNEYLIISIIIAAAIFIVILVTFKRFSIPSILVVLIETAVLLTTCSMALGNSPMYFIALIIVQSMLMGSMVDYGILLTSYYRDLRNNFDVKESVVNALTKSMRTILTSSSVMTITAFILGIVMKDVVAEILFVLSIGTLVATLLIIFVLPSLLVVFDKFITLKKKS